LIRHQRSAGKDDRKIEATIAQQQKEIQTLVVSVWEQSAQIQKVNARLEASNAVSQTAFNDR
jgi:F0F1-type ATP synthase alpha subunit